MWQCGMRVAYLNKVKGGKGKMEEETVAQGRDVKKGGRCLLSPAFDSEGEYGEERYGSSLLANARFGVIARLSCETSYIGTLSEIRLGGFKKRCKK